MPETFLHGVEVVEITDGPRPIRTVRSGIIGLIGTAPDSQQEVKASLLTGVAADNNALTFTSKLEGELGNNTGIRFVDPKANSAALSVSVVNGDITVSLATDADGDITSTAAEVRSAIMAKAEAHALVKVANTGGGGATATATLSTSTIGSIAVTNGGSGYLTPPAVVIAGGGGSGATATAVLTDGVVTSITVNNPGTGYSSPTVTITPPTGGSSGAGVVSAFRRQSLADGLNDEFPLNRPVLVAGDAAKAAKLGETGTLPGAMDGIFDQVGAVVIVVRVAEGEDDEDTITNVIGGINTGDDTYEGVHAFLGAESITGFCPRILCAPGFTSQRPDDTANAVVAELVGIAERLRAVIIADGPSTTDADAIEYRGDWGSKRVYVVDPAVKIRNSNGELVNEPASARVAGLIAKMDNDRGFWWSPSNQVINGIVGTAREIDFTLGDQNSRANLLNEQEVATIVRQDGFRLWGNRTCADDPKFAFLSVVRTADMINDSILRAHLWAIDRNITRSFLEDVSQSVNDYIALLTAEGAILGGRCFPSPNLNTPAAIADGKVFFDFEFTPNFPAEHITFRSKIVNDYIEQIL